MQRKIYQDLINWKNNKDHKPLMILGARQVGKTYIIREFCKNEFKNFVEINLFEREDIISIYKSNEPSTSKLIKLKALINMDIENEDTVFFIDEIQQSEEIISELKFFNERHPKMNIICAGSLLGVKLKRSSFSFPVGKVKMLNMYPLNFEEFLLAFNEKSLLDLIVDSFKTNKELCPALHNKALNYYRYYLCVGGMPEMVKNLIDNLSDVTMCDKSIIKNILDSYYIDMNKYIINKNESIKIERTYNSVATQLGNDSNRFKFKSIFTGAKRRDYESAMDWLIASNVILKSFNVTLPEIPLKGFINLDYYKMFLSDVGILTSMLDINFGEILTDNISLYKGAIAENFVATNLASYDKDLYYFNRIKSNNPLEIDFLINTNDGIIPIEVKAGDKVKSKMLDKYITEYKPKYAIRISTKNFGFINNIKSIPLYAIFCIKDL
ncbi:MAG: AAA family ATPase [Bacilli bacterium]